MLSKLNLTQEQMQLDRGQVRSRSLPSHRWRPLCVLFVHLDANVMEACTQELNKAQFTVKSDFVLNLAQSASQLRVQPADVMIVDYPSPACKESQVLQLVHGSVHGLPIIFLTS
jgi:DNA-binding NtrC family response regulator